MVYRALEHLQARGRCRQHPSMRTTHRAQVAASMGTGWEGPAPDSRGQPVLGKRSPDRRRPPRREDRAFKAQPGLMPPPSSGDRTLPLLSTSLSLVEENGQREKRHTDDRVQPDRVACPKREVAALDG